MRIGTLAVILVPLTMTAPRAIAQPMDQAEAEDQYDDAAPGEPVDNVDVFYDRLSDDGTWVDEPDIGHVFIPQQDNFVPYHNGYWRNTSVGFVWVSNEPFAWATTHYGRWAFSRPYNRWVWLPDTTWGPSWVDWRTSGDHLGWAPLAPEIVIRTGYVTPVEYWHYAPGNRILDAHINTYYVPRERIVTFHRSAVVMEHYRTIGGARVVVGPPAARLRSYGYTPAQYRPVKIETRLAGRMTAVEYRGAVQRAHERHDYIETRNRQRIEANPHIREVHTQATVKWQGRVEPGRPAGHVEPVHPGNPGHVEPVRPGYPGHVEPAHPGNPGHEPARPGYPGKIEPPPTHTQPPGPTYGGPGHQAPPPTHTQPPGPTYGGPGHQAPPPTPPAHTQPPGPTYGGPTHQAPPPGPTHTAPPPTHNPPTYGGPTHTAPPPTHTGGATYTGGGAHQAPPPSRPPPARTPPSKDPKKK